MGSAADSLLGHGAGAAGGGSNNSSSSAVAAADGRSGVAGANSWEVQYLALLRFVEVHGHARVPCRFTEDPHLGWWVSTQRRAYAAELERKASREPRCHVRITAARVKKLERIGFQWKVPAGTWDERFVALREFVKKHAHARVPQLFEEDPCLGQWVHRQRQAYAAELERKAGGEPRCHKRITAARVKKLERIGFEWDVGTGRGR